LGSFRFGFFSFRLIKPKPNRTGQFFQNSNRFFSRFGFSVIFFPDFLSVLVFLLTPSWHCSTNSFFFFFNFLIY
jgi:hypothetical protein